MNSLNLNSEFYTSYCNDYNRKFKTDITLGYRILYFHPRVNICSTFCNYIRQILKN